MSISRPHAVLALVCVAAIAVEVYVVFVGRNDEFRIEGVQRYQLEGFATGARVSQAFLMRGDGLHAVRIQLNSEAAASARVHWVLRRGTPVVPQDLSVAFETVETFDLRPGPQWKSLVFTRDGSSRDRWYTIEVTLLQAVATAPSSGAPSRPARVSLMASRDNPERGGVLWVNGVHQSGSLVMRADRHGRTPYRRFEAEVEPHLPYLLKVHAVQWAVVVAVHWAFVVFAWAVISESRRGPQSVASP